MTTIKIPTPMVRKIESRMTGGINAWFASQGFTVVNRLRDKREWKIELRENLNASQKTGLSDALDALLQAAQSAESAITWE